MILEYYKHIYSSKKLFLNVALLVSKYIIWIKYYVKYKKYREKHFQVIFL